MNELVKHFVDKLKDGGYTRITNVAGNVLLRPNDSTAFMGKERFQALKSALEIVLDGYKEDDIYKYYYTFDREKHGFSNFERWKNWFNK